jgi:hypothetical protein
MQPSASYTGRQAGWRSGNTLDLYFEGLGSNRGQDTGNSEGFRCFPESFLEGWVLISIGPQSNSFHFINRRTIRRCIAYIRGEQPHGTGGPHLTSRFVAWARK